MQVVNPEIVSGKRVLLRYDIDVALRLASLAQGKPSGHGEMVVTEDFKLKAGLSTLKLCLENAKKVILMGHLGRPEGKVVEELRVAPVAAKYGYWRINRTRLWLKLRLLLPPAYDSIKYIFPAGN